MQCPVGLRFLIPPQVSFSFLVCVCTTADACLHRPGCYGNAAKPERKNRISERLTVEMRDVIFICKKYLNNTEYFYLENISVRYSI